MLYACSRSNRHIEVEFESSWLLQTNQSSGVGTSRWSLSGDVINTTMMQAVRHLVLEYEIGLQNLYLRYQENDPLSPWHTLARAAVHASKR